jgi:hypothetical protein
MNITGEKPEISSHRSWCKNLKDADFRVLFSYLQVSGKHFEHLA